jgi:excinuclease UvrABC nuclease subunit
MQSIKATGISGSSYTFEIYSFETPFNPVGAIYIFLRDTIAIYVGKAKDLSSRLSNHHKEQEARRLGANRIAVLVVGDEATRDRIERDLIPALQPACNDLLK